MGVGNRGVFAGVFPASYREGLLHYKCSAGVACLSRTQAVDGWRGAQ